MRSLRASPRKPARAFRKMSPARVKMARGSFLVRAGREDLAHKFRQYRTIIRGAEDFLKQEYPSGSRFIFVGRGMRPLFEAVKGINHVRRLHPKRDFSYVALPAARSNLREEDRVHRLTLELRETPVLSTGRRNYYVVDRVDSGYSIKLIRRAILKLQPDAAVHILSQESGIGGIVESDGIPRPTKLVRPYDSVQDARPVIRDAYVLFQNTLRKYLARVARRE